MVFESEAVSPGLIFIIRMVFLNGGFIGRTVKRLDLIAITLSDDFAF